MISGSEAGYCQHFTHMNEHFQRNAYLNHWLADKITDAIAVSTNRVSDGEEGDEGGEGGRSSLYR